MNKLLRLLFICVCCCATSTSVWAQNGGALISVGKNVATGGVSAASHLPAAGKAAVVSTEKVTQAINTAQHGAQATAQGISSQRTMPAGATAPSATATPGTGNSSLNTNRVQPPNVAQKMDLFTPPQQNYNPVEWAQNLITQETQPEVSMLYRSLARQLNFVHNFRSQFSEEQLARIDEAEKYFLNLTPEQANDIQTLSSAQFREYTMTLRSPDATEYGYFFTGNGLLGDYESRQNLDSGYIPVYLGEPDKGLNVWNMRELIPSPVKTNRPIFVLLDIHGGINFLNNFHAGINSVRTISTQEIVEAMQELRQATGTPEVNLFADSCCTGALLDEFESLPLSQRQGINVFVPTGGSQCTYISATAHYRTHIPGKNIAKELTEKMIEQIVNGHVMAQANIAGQSFNPLQLAIERANKLHDQHLLQGLSGTFNRQKTKQHTPGSSRVADESARYFIARVAYEEATARYGKIFEGNDWFKNAMKKLKADYATRYNIPPEDWFLEERFFDGRFDNKPIQ